MINMTLAEAATLLGLNTTINTAFCGVSIDTRSLSPGNLFVAIPGSQVDGHDFVEAARDKGAAAAIVSRKVASVLPQLVVDDVTLALGRLSAAWRNRFTIPFIAVTGSNGKTTLKNMLASIMLAACENNSAGVLATQGNLNNHLGLPLTLLRLNAQHRYAIIEMGMSHFGEIAYLTKLTQPDVAVITNAAAAHIEGVGDVAGVARAKAEIFLGLPPNGTAILNRDDAFFSYWQQQLKSHRIISFGLHHNAEIRTTLHQAGHTQHLTIHTTHGDIDMHLPLLGLHNVQNALAAAAAALAIGIDLNIIKTGLENVTPEHGRMEIHTLANGTHLIDDTYNANPFSLQAAVNTLATFSGKKILVLGDMKELGNAATSLHANAGEKIRDAGIDALYTYGELTTNTAQAFGAGAHHFTEQDKLVNALKPLLQNHTTILVKGSRSMRMEKIVSGLLHNTST